MRLALPTGGRRRPPAPAAVAAAIGLEGLRRAPHATNNHVSGADVDAYAPCVTVPAP